MASRISGRGQKRCREDDDNNSHGAKRPSPPTAGPSRSNVDAGASPWARSSWSPQPDNGAADTAAAYNRANAESAYHQYPGGQSMLTTQQIADAIEEEEMMLDEEEAEYAAKKKANKKANKKKEREVWGPRKKFGSKAKNAAPKNPGPIKQKDSPFVVKILPVAQVPALVGVLRANLSRSADAQEPLPFGLHHDEQVFVGDQPAGVPWVQLLGPSGHVKAPYGVVQPQYWDVMLEQITRKTVGCTFHREPPPPRASPAEPIAAPAPSSVDPTPVLAPPAFSSTLDSAALETSRATSKKAGNELSEAEYAARRAKWANTPGITIRRKEPQAAVVPIAPVSHPATLQTPLRFPSIPPRGPSPSLSPIEQSPPPPSPSPIRFPSIPSRPQTPPDIEMPPWDESARAPSPERASASERSSLSESESSCEHAPLHERESSYERALASARVQTPSPPAASRVLTPPPPATSRVLAAFQARQEHGRSRLPDLRGGNSPPSGSITASPSQTRQIPLVATRAPPLPVPLGPLPADGKSINAEYGPVPRGRPGSRGRDATARSSRGRGGAQQAPRATSLTRAPQFSPPAMESAPAPDSSLPPLPSFSQPRPEWHTPAPDVGTSLPRPIATVAASAPRLRDALDDIREGAWSGDLPAFDKLQQLDTICPHTISVRWPNRAILVGTWTTRLPPTPLAPNIVKRLYDDGLMGDIEYTLEPQLFQPDSLYLAFCPVFNDPEQKAGHHWFRDLTHSDLTNHPDRPHLQTLSKKTLDEYTAHANAVRQSYVTVVGEMEVAMREDVWDISTADRRFKAMKDMQAPQREYDRLGLAMQALQDGVKSRAHAKIYWAAMLRCARVLVSYMNACFLIPPNAKLRERLRKFRSMLEFPIRGVIFDGVTAPLYYRAFLKEQWTVYAIIWLDAVHHDLKDDRIRLSGEVKEGERLRLRGSREIDVAIDKIVVQETLTLETWVRPPPPGVPSHAIERVVRGILTWPSVLEADKQKEYDAAQAKRAWDAIKGQALTIDGVTLKNRNSLCQHLATQIRNAATARLPSWAPAVPASAGYALVRAFRHLGLLPDETGAATYFTPPLFVFISTKKTVYRAVVVLIKIFPFLIQRARLARLARLAGLPPMRGLTAEEWREVFAGAYFKNGPWNDESDHTPFTVDGDFMKHGGELLFGRAYSDELRREFRKPAEERQLSIEIGGLPGLGHVTMASVEGNEALCAWAALAINRLNLLDAASLVAQDALAAANVPEAYSFRGRVIRMPDFSTPALENDPPVVKSIRRLVLGNADAYLGDFLQPPLDISSSPDAHGKFVEDLYAFVTQFVDKAAEFERGGSFGVTGKGEPIEPWTAYRRPGRTDFSSPLQRPFDANEVVFYEQEMIDRLTASCLRASTKPVSFYPATPAPALLLPSVQPAA